MAFDGITVAALVEELKEHLQDGRIHKIAQPEADELLITMKTKRGAKRLYISASASLPLIYLTEENKPSPMTAPNFCMLLRKHIGSGRITGISQPGLERIINFEIEHLDELGDLCKKVLIVEIMGKHSNIIFCNDEKTVIDSIKHVSAQISSVREVLPGRQYFIPDTMGKQDPCTVSAEKFEQIMVQLPMPLGKAIYTGFTGISPGAAEEILYLSGLPSEMTYRDLSQDMAYHLFTQFRYYIEQVIQHSFTPAIYYMGAEPIEFSCLKLTHFACNQDSKRTTITRKEYTSVSGMLHTYYASRNTITRIRQKSSDLRRVVQTALDRNRKKYDLQNRQLKDTEGREKFKVYGELINTYGYGVSEGDKELEALNYYTDKMIKIPLDSAKSPAENAQRYFMKYNKQKRTFEAMGKLLEETKVDITYLESILNSLNIAQSEDDLLEIKEELIKSGYIRRKQVKQKVKIKSKPFHYISSDGFHMYVGKNNLQNDELTFHFAVGNDWWFHSKGAPGSHVIVKTNGEELPDRTFEEAGRLAAFYSAARGGDKIEIDYVEKKQVKKPNGAKPGFVVYYTNYSLIIDSDISGIELLES